MPEKASSSTWLITLLIGLFVMGVCLVVWHLNGFSHRLAVTAARQNAAAYSDALTVLRSRYTSEVVQRVKGHGIEVTHDYVDKEAAIPLPATFTIDLGEHIGAMGAGSNVRLFSDLPFPWRARRRLDAIDLSALTQLRDNPDQPIEHIDWEHGVLRYATADRMQQSCVDCHNAHPESPKTDWKVGDVRGVLEVTLPIDQVVAETHAGLRGTIVLMTTLGVMGLLGLVLVVSRFRSTSIELQRRADSANAALIDQQQANEQLDRQSAEIQQSNRRLEARRIELDSANQDLQAQAARLTKTNESIGRAVDALSHTAREILAGASNQSEGARQQSDSVSRIVATVAEFSEVAASTSRHASEVAQAARQTTQTGEEGRVAVENAKVAMLDVREHAESIAQRISHLAQHASEIESITNSAKVIANQTNILALNAAVEASRAGEHGKGFAVVAAEIKALAEQSRQATVQVRRILGEIQDATQQAVISIGHGTRSVTLAEQIVCQADDTIRTLSSALSVSSVSAETISESASKQATHAQRLDEMLSAIEKVVRQNVTAISQIEQAAQRLNALSRELASLR